MIFDYKYPWQQQFFDKFNEIDTDLIIPLSDGEAYRKYPNHSWVYNKLSLMEALKYPCAPHGIYPKDIDYPVISKPITNLTGMGAGIEFSSNPGSLDEHYTPGHFWTKQFFGRHISIDLLIKNGEIVWFCPTEGIPDQIRVGAFEAWNILTDFIIPEPISLFFNEYFKEFKGIVNIELIGEHMIEMHLRMSSQWIDLNGETWTQDLINFYLFNSTEINRNIPKGHSIPLFLDDYPSQQLSEKFINDTIDIFKLSSIQITYDINKLRNRSSMPPGGVRVAVINSTIYYSAILAKEHIRNQFQTP